MIVAAVSQLHFTKYTAHPMPLTVLTWSLPSTFNKRTPSSMMTHSTLVVKFFILSTLLFWQDVQTCDL